MRLLEFFRPYRLIVSRRVSEEEQVTVEAFSRTEHEAAARLDVFLGVMRAHRKRSNEEVVAATRQQLAALDTAIQTRGATLHEMEQKLEQLRAECRKFDEILQGKKRRAHGLVPIPNGVDRA